MVATQWVKERRCPLARAFASLVVVVVGVFDVAVVVVSVAQTDLVVGAVCVDKETKKWKKEKQTSVWLCSLVVAVEESDLES